MMQIIFNKYNFARIVRDELKISESLPNESILTEPDSRQLSEQY